eukprot:CAMPEP_0168572994 /NCGR_PEP_ID=MMETSP0413-20121227/18273_1 /TAXON_ID=136452 /ORGANISM="Filamoeba nolandi, Strain NC-AS-23-1" /LENGTH=56 /DNA_ID=CAMNT_0008606165 /DNA_START=11 /DNA_END=181 /DNA_ORIENTATION=+
MIAIVGSMEWEVFKTMLGNQAAGFLQDLGSIITTGKTLCSMENQEQLRSVDEHPRN